MENDGRGCYLQASDRSGSEVGKELLEPLAAEKDASQHKFEAFMTLSVIKEAGQRLTFDWMDGNG